MKNSLQKMIRDIESEVQYTRSMIGKNRLDARVMKVMAEVPGELIEQLEPGGILLTPAAADIDVEEILIRPATGSGRLSAEQ